LVAGALAALASIPAGPASAQQNKLAPATVTVENTRDVPAVVYAQSDGFDIRLGSVPGHGKQTLQLPEFLEGVGEVQVFVHPEGGFDMASGELLVKPGENLDVLVPTNDSGYIREVPEETIPNPGDNLSTVTVKNDRPEMVTVFLENGDFDYRIGTVPGTREATLVLPQTLVEGRQEVEFFVHPEKGFDLGSELFDLTNPAHLYLVVPNK